MATPDREYAVRVIDTAPGVKERIIPVGNRHQADRRVEHYERINSTRGTYPVEATVVFRYSFMPDMPWEEA